MVSFRFPFSFPQPNDNINPHPPTTPSRPTFPPATTILTATTTLTAAGLALYLTTEPNLPHKFLQNALDFFTSHYQRNLNFSSYAPTWASMSLSNFDGNDGTGMVVESKTGAAFPAVLSGSKKLLGIGLRKKSVLGLKNIDVYAFGVYTDDRDLESMLREKYCGLSVSELKENKEFLEDVFNNDISMTIRLQIVYGRLSILSVRSAFEESIGSRLQKFAGPDNKDLLHRFTSSFSDEIKLPKGSLIDISREKGHVLRTTIEGKEVGCIQSKLLSRCILDLYIGEKSFDNFAKEDIMLNLASLLQK